MNPGIDSSRPFSGREFAKTLTQSAGVYRMLGAGDAVLYVGKAKNLRRRVESYFARPQADTRLQRMVSLVERIEVIVTRTEAEALLLENQLIKSLKPRYNIELRDDKSYPYIYLDDRHDFPRLTFYRGARHAGGRYFGPFANAWAVRDTLSTLHKLFGLRSCTDSIFRNRCRPCLEYQMQRCSGPCVGLIEQAAYARRLAQAVLFLDGRSQEVVSQLGLEMEAASASLDFERAAEIRDRLGALQRIVAKQFVAGERGDVDVFTVIVAEGIVCVHILMFRAGLSHGSRTLLPKLKADVPLDELSAHLLIAHYSEHPIPAEVIVSPAPDGHAAVEEALSLLALRRVAIVTAPRGTRAKWLEMGQHTARSMLDTEIASKATLQARFAAMRELLDLDSQCQRIECFDISHTQGEATVASCVVFNEDGAVKADYRRFNISGITPGDDYAAMEQALSRRFARLVAGEGVKPDLLLIDGGRGQVAQAFLALDALGLHGIVVVGVAKGPERRAGHETLLVGRDCREIVPGPTSLASHLIQQVRDEAHRFAITGHRMRRGKARTQSALEDVPGIGPKKRQLLLQHFGGVQALKKAAVGELQQVAGVSAALAQRIHDALH